MNSILSALNIEYQTIIITLFLLHFLKNILYALLIFESLNANIFANYCSYNCIRELCRLFLIIYASVWPLWYCFIFQTDFIIFEKFKFNPVSLKINLRIFTFYYETFKSFFCWFLQIILWLIFPYTIASQALRQLYLGTTLRKLNSLLIFRVVRKIWKN